MARTDRLAPVVYGSPNQVAVLLDSITRMMEREPAEVFQDAEVKHSVARLSGLICGRVAEQEAPACSDAPSEQPPRAQESSVTVLSDLAGV